MTITYQSLTELAQKIKNKTKRENALQLLENMQMEIPGIGDTPVRWKPSFIKVVQGTTDTSKFTDKVASGDIVWGDSLKGALTQVIPLTSFQGRQMWDPDPNNVILLCSSPDAKVGFKYGECKKCAFSKFDEAAKKSACSLNYTFYVLSPDFKDVGQVSFSKTSYSNGAAWVKLLRQGGGYPYRNMFNLKSKKSTQYKNVNLLEAEGIAGKIPYEEGEQEFVHDLYMFFYNSREEFLKTWDEDHRTPQALTNQAPAVPQIASSSILEADTSDTVSSEATKYEM